MSFTFNSNGVTTQTNDELYEQLTQELYLIYGNDINLTASSPDGQRLGIFTKLNIDMQAQILSMYSQLDPNLASGTMLERIAKFSGTNRIPATKSQADIEVVITTNATLPSGFQVIDDVGQVWLTNSERVLTPGTHTVTVFAEQFGEVEALPNTITQAATIIRGVDSVNNPLAATVGKAEETDVELRQRLKRVLENPDLTATGRLLVALASIAGVTDLWVYENYTSEYNEDIDLKDHSIWAVIEGGSVSDITEVIAKNKDAGCGMKGQIKGTYNEEITIAGNPYTVSQVYVFDRPTISDIYVTVDIEAKNGITVNEDLIKQALADENYRIGQEMVVSKLYSIIYSVQNENIIATNLRISSNGTDFVSDIIEDQPGLKYDIKEENITINIVEGN